MENENCDGRKRAIGNSIDHNHPARVILFYSSFNQHITKSSIRKSNRFIRLQSDVIRSSKISSTSIHRLVIEGSSKRASSRFIYGIDKKCEEREPKCARMVNKNAPKFHRNLDFFHSSHFKQEMRNYSEFGASKFARFLSVFYGISLEAFLLLRTMTKTNKSHLGDLCGVICRNCC